MDYQPFKKNPATFHRNDPWPQVDFYEERKSSKLGRRIMLVILAVVVYYVASK